MGGDFGGLKSLAKLEAKPIGKGHKVVTGMRGSYGGVLMFGMLYLVGRARHVQPAVARGRVCCWAARPTRRTWRTG